MARRRKHIPGNAAERTRGIYTVKISHNKKTIDFTNTWIHIAPTWIDASVRPFFIFLGMSASLLLIMDSDKPQKRGKKRA